MQHNKRNALAYRALLGLSKAVQADYIVELQLRERYQSMETPVGDFDTFFETFAAILKQCKVAPITDACLADVPEEHLALAWELFVEQFKYRGLLLDGNLNGRLSDISRSLELEDNEDFRAMMLELIQELLRTAHWAANAQVSVIEEIDSHPVRLRPHDIGDRI